ncbi:MAG: GntR family transcriptional regulator [Azospirillaceae bacterium]
MAGRLKRVEKATLQQRVCDELKRALMSGRFVPGEVITLRRVADEMGTSAMPVREAMMRLIAERALEMLPNRTVRVRLMSVDQLRDLWSVRVFLEGEAAARAAMNAKPGEIARLTQLNREIARIFDSGDMMGMVKLNQQFHFMLYGLSRSDHLMAIIEGLWLQTGPYLMASVGRASTKAQAENAETRRNLIVHHGDVLRALAERDGELARRAIAEDIGNAATLVIAEAEALEMTKGAAEDGQQLRATGSLG